MIDVEITLNDTPPTLNQLGGHHHGSKFHGSKKAWQSDIEKALMALGPRLPRGLHAIGAGAHLTFPRPRRRDEINYKAILEKALGDALVNGGWIPDDTPEHFRMGQLVLEYQRDVRRTRIILYAYPTGEGDR